MTLRYPEVSAIAPLLECFVRYDACNAAILITQTPTEDDRLALKSYFHLFSRLYPCGECAEEFQKLLKEYPPQVSWALGDTRR